MLRKGNRVEFLLFDKWVAGKVGSVSMISPHADIDYLSDTGIQLTMNVHMSKIRRLR